MRWTMPGSENEVLVVEVGCPLFSCEMPQMAAGDLPVRAVAAEAGRSPSRIQQIATAAAPLPELEAAPAQLRQAGWPAPEGPAGSDDEELDGRDSIAERLVDEVLGTSTSWPVPARWPTWTRPPSSATGALSCDAAWLSPGAPA
ncbi:hypothetical protein AB0B45_44930 [Nonomuraea sp. NPDC049152]|uniref:hypothetical protein n=1 Tax=Nonomuraea sp. NPDC049152 TaxID=3154350 RepID=UPI00340B21B7